LSSFDTIRSVAADNDSTWRDKVFLTFDIDWAHDEVLSDTIDLVERTDVAATWFVTHDTPLLDRLRGNPKFELGIHPNFNFLLQGDDRNGRTAQEVVDRVRMIVPDALSIRSHSMAQSSQLLDLFAREGLSHDCNHFIPAHVDIELKCWLLWNGMVRVPYFWEDDLACVNADSASRNNMTDLVRRPGLRVFDFHPIHVFLNTEHLSRYQHTRPLHDKPDELIRQRHEGEGTRTLLMDLLQSGTVGPDSRPVAT
jgi:hypothetical protein